MLKGTKIYSILRLAGWQVFFKTIFCFHSFQSNLLQNFCNSVTYSKKLKESINNKVVIRLQKGYKKVTNLKLVTKKFVTIQTGANRLQTFYGCFLPGYKPVVTNNILIINYLGYKVTEVTRLQNFRHFIQRKK